MKNVKDQQIETQKETIESLTKKVESLSRELEKCLDPGSDSDRAAGRRKELDAEEEEDFQNTCYLMERVISGVMGIEGGGDYVIWMKLRDVLLTHSAAKPLMTDPDFIHGIHLVTMITERTCIMFHMGKEQMEMHRDNEFGPSEPESDKPFYYRYWQSVPVIAMGAPNGQAKFIDYRIEETLRAYVKIREVLAVTGDFYQPGTSDYTEIKAILDTFIFSLGYIIKNHLR